MKEKNKDLVSEKLVRVKFTTERNDEADISGIGGLIVRVKCKGLT